MSLFDFLKVPEPTDCLETLRSGPVIVDGVVQSTDSMRSPVRGEACVGFFYQGFLMIGGRQPMVHKMKNHEGYAPFVLVMKDGELDVEPRTPGGFTQGDHQELLTQYAGEYQATEELVRPGDKVRVEGKLREKHGSLVLRMKSVSVLEKQVSKGGASDERLSRRQQKKARRRS